MILWLIFLSILALGLIVFLSAVEMACSQLSRVSLRALAERERDRRLPLLARAARDRAGFLIPLQFAVAILIVVGTLVTLLLFREIGIPQPLLWTFFATVATVSLGRLVVPRLFSHGDPEATFLRLIPVLSILYRLLSSLSAPWIHLAKITHRLSSPRNGQEITQEEPSEEEIQAYLDVGEEVGIFEEQETELIQSALEFGSTLVREIMTPRTEIIAIQDAATVSELKDLIVSSKFSRIPVYRVNLENIVGVVYVRNILAALDENGLDKPVTPFLKKPWFVPETKKVAGLLKEMQKKSEPMAIVVNEYGSVSGLITIEDLIEELVGEIYDEDERQTVELQEERNGSFRVRGSVGIEDLEDALGVDLGEPAMSTVSGLVVDFLGEVPVGGQILTVGELEVEILDADRKKINWMRIRRRIGSNPDLVGDAPDLEEAES